MYKKEKEIINKIGNKNDKQSIQKRYNQKGNLSY